MVKVPNKVIKLVKKFLGELETNRIHVIRAILFGSYVNGSFNEWSDIDLLIVSDSFTGISLSL